MISNLVLPAHLHEQIGGEARRAFPRECCGLVEGVCEVSTVRATVLHPVSNVATEPDRFEIDPAAHIALLRSLRGSGRSIVGCYHSHPNGEAAPSLRDAESATEAGFLWLIVSLTERTAELRIAAFVSTGSSLLAVLLAVGVETADHRGTAGVSPARGRTVAVPR